MNMDTALAKHYWRTYSTRIDQLIAKLVHASASSDPLIEARHRNFQMTHIASGILATTFLIVYFSAYNVRSLHSYVFYFWFASPLAIAYYLSRTGRIDVAQFFSALNLSGLAGCAAYYTGGINSPLILWLLLVPLEAALSRRRMMTYWGVVVSCTTLIGLYALTMTGRVPTPLTSGIGEESFAFYTTLAAIAYAGGLAGTVQTIHRRSSAALNESRESYSFLADNATDLITRHGPNGEVLFASRACEKIIGLPAEDLEKNGLLDWVHIADRPAYMHALSTSASQHKTISAEFRIKKIATNNTDKKSSEYAWVEMRCRPVGKTSGQLFNGFKPTEVLAVTRDISLRKSQEIELERAKEHAESANRAKSLFIASISHELRTPLNSIIGFSDILKNQLRNSGGDEKLVEYSEIIEQSGQHLGKIVNDILDISKIEAGKFEISPDTCDIDELICLCSDTVSLQSGAKNIVIDYEGLQDDREIQCDERALKQILINLLSNAAKFSHNDGRIIIAAERIKDDMILKVIDHGVGISPENIAKLGRPFVQAENEYSRQFEGTGLGLCVVFGLVQLHAGEIKIESELGSGTTVEIKLPVMGPASTPADLVAISKHGHNYDDTHQGNVKKRRNAEPVAAQISALAS